ncbi:NAD-dependent epimerase/dehydratase family protein [Pisciglobus halotolerans]|uniref:UDP-glucose 4-epimerase n=1 Tax=Pisciglobus halotolerans TaxID=745365 RepID=A0A1I3DL10_9LACT|nr:NAD-dependent epimerase/dehydratase family protein [Pisciglobus halotolerans]SFH87363.1 UDP-glucose 4-epimerase [Pisciglobus halotolerans]
MVKKILITGKNSYIGNSLANWLNQFPEEYIITKESVRDDKWKEIDFSIFDVVVHVAGIAHQDTKADQEEFYYKVNTELTIDIAKKAKKQGVKQFIFLSSIIVYGASGKIGEKKIITRETVPKPINFYGNSKLLAEKGIKPLQSKNFNIVIVRPPMIYGKGAKGNYHLLSKFAKVTPFFLNIENQRSMLYIDNLTEFIRLLIQNEENGLYFPQNEEYVRTLEIVQLIAERNGKKIISTRVFNFLLKKLGKRVTIINKVFGNLVYSKELSKYKCIYNVRTLEESIELSEGD